VHFYRGRDFHRRVDPPTRLVRASWASERLECAPLACTDFCLNFPFDRTVYSMCWFATNLEIGRTASEKDWKPDACDRSDLFFRRRGNFFYMADDRPFWRKQLGCFDRRISASVTFLDSVRDRPVPCRNRGSYHGCDLYWRNLGRDPALSKGRTEKGARLSSAEWFKQRNRKSTRARWLINAVVTRPVLAGSTRYPLELYRWARIWSSDQEKE
jgi:hypothetical protein